MVDRHIALPGTFKEGDIVKWLQKFSICATANGWDKAAQAKKIYLEMAEDDKKRYRCYYVGAHQGIYPR